jgi:glycosyltransferase involved in cell wall biosynthesis
MSIVRTEIPDAEALFVGKNSDQREGLSYLEWIRKTASDLTGCRFIEQVPQSDVLNFLSTSRVLAVPSWHEVYSVVALEAMAAGRPVVVTATNGAAELVEETGAGRVVPATLLTWVREREKRLKSGWMRTRSQYNVRQLTVEPSPAHAMVCGSQENLTH